MLKSPDQSRYSSEKPLKRGKACLTCRFLKIKCDGKRPVCGPCFRHPKEDPCEYSEGPGRSRYRALEETISRLESRLRELENPDDAPSVTLHDPYVHQSMSPPQTSYSSRSPPLSSYSPTSPQMMTSPLSMKSSPSASGSMPLSTSSPGVDDYSLRGLIDAFVPHASQFGFFLDVSRFYRSLQTTTAGNNTRPCTALLSAVALWGSHLSPPESRMRTREPSLLLQAQIDAATSLTKQEDHPQRLIHTIQAEVLLAYYHWRVGQLLEAKAHSATASSLVLSSGFHQCRSGNQHIAARIIRVSSHSPEYPPRSTDTVEEGERINGCWAAYILSTLLGLATEQPTTIGSVFDVPGVQIDTPWPLEMSDYAKGQLPRQSVATISKYLSYSVSDSDNSEPSALELVAKGTILLYHATRLNAQSYNSRSQTFFTHFQALNTHIIEYCRRLPALADCASTNEPYAQALYLGHCLANVAALRLHIPFYDDTTSKHTSLVSAEALFRPGGYDVLHFSNVHPMFGTLWMNACEVLIGHLQTPDGRWPPDIDPRSEDGRLLSSLQYGLSVFEHFSPDSTMTSKSSSSTKRVFDYPCRDDQALMANYDPQNVTMADSDAASSWVDYLLSFVKVEAPEYPQETDDTIFYNEKPPAYPTPPPVYIPRSFT